MNNVQDVIDLLPNLTPGEKMELLQRLASDITQTFPGVDSRPGVCGGDPCIVRTRIPVWVLEQARRQGMSEAAMLQSYPQLQAEDLANAWAYVQGNRSEVDALIHGNEVA